MANTFNSNNRNLATIPGTRAFRQAMQAASNAEALRMVETLVDEFILSLDQNDGRVNQHIGTTLLVLAEYMINNIILADENEYPMVGPDGRLITASLQEQSDRIFARKPVQTTSGSLFLGDTLALEDNGGFASYVNLLTSVTGNLLNYRTYLRGDGTTDFSESVRLGAEEFGTFQPGFDETETIQPGEFVSAVFTQLQNAFNYAHIFRGTAGQLVFDLYVDPQNRDLPPDNFTDAQMLAIPRDEMLKLVDRLSDFSDTADFDNPDDPGNDADTITYKVPRDFTLNRKLVIDWTTPNNSPVTVKGDTIGGNFIPYFQTFFADRFIDRSYLDRHITVVETTTLDAPYTTVATDPTTAAFDLTLVDATLFEGIKTTISKLLGTTNNVTIKPKAGQTINGQSEYILEGASDPSVSLFSDGTTNWNIFSIKRTGAKGAFFMHDNVTATNINTVNVYEDIAGTAAAADLNIRFDFATAPNSLTYVGERDVPLFIGTCHGSVVRDSGAASVSVRVAGFLNGVEIEEATSVTTATNRKQTFSFPVIVTGVVTDDVVTVKIRNETDTANLVVTDIGLVELENLA